MPLSAMKRTAWPGQIARNTDGSRTTWLRPSTARVTNHTTITGPNTRPMAAVPLRCTANRPIRITMAVGTTAALERRGRPP